MPPTRLPHSIGAPGFAAQTQRGQRNNRSTSLGNAPLEFEQDYDHTLPLPPPASQRLPPFHENELEEGEESYADGEGYEYEHAWDFEPEESEQEDFGEEEMYGYDLEDFYDEEMARRAAWDEEYENALQQLYDKVPQQPPQPANARIPTRMMAVRRPSQGNHYARFPQTPRPPPTARFPQTAACPPLPAGSPYTRPPQTHTHRFSAQHGNVYGPRPPAPPPAPPRRPPGTTTAITTATAHDSSEGDDPDFEDLDPNFEDLDSDFEDLSQRMQDPEWDHTPADDYFPEWAKVKTFTEVPEARRRGIVESLRVDDLLVKDFFCFIVVFRASD